MHLVGCGRCCTDMNVLQALSIKLVSSLKSHASDISSSISSGFHILTDVSVLGRQGPCKPPRDSLSRQP